jgi:peroxiredoxin Q/BCP
MADATFHISFLFGIRPHWRPSCGGAMRVLTLLAIGLVAVGLSGHLSAATELKVGDIAPDFTLQASNGKTYKVSDFKNKQATVLAWFPKAYTRGCTLECKSLAEHGDMIKKYDVTYFMISVDPIDQNTAFAEQQHADFPLLSDPTKKTAGAYGVLDMLGIAHRWTFYIGKDGKIQAIDKSVKPATSAEDMAAKLHELGVSMRGQ